MEGWIKLYRKLLDSTMYKSLNATQREILLQCLLLANHKPSDWIFQGKLCTCKPGQFKTSIEEIRHRCAKGTTTKQVRSALEKLVMWRFLASQGAKDGTIITILNWDAYQCEGTCEGQTKGQEEGKKRATNKNVKKDKKYNKSNKDLSALQDLWNLVCGKLSKVLESTDSREKKEIIRLTERPLEEWKRVFSKMAKSDFCTGKNDRGWKADYNWIMENPENSIKVLEGKYDTLTLLDQVAL